jgi:hypothetical protein
MRAKIPYYDKIALGAVQDPCALTTVATTPRLAASRPPDDGAVVIQGCRATGPDDETELPDPPPPATRR